MQQAYSLRQVDLCNNADQENKYDLLCEAYSHLDIEFIKGSSSELEIKEKIRLFVEPRAKFLFGEDIKIDIELDEGSFISKISILGFIGGIIMGYPQFKEGIRELQNDAVLITQAANMETIFITETKSCDRLRLEKRKGIPGRTQEIINKIETIRIAAENTGLPDTKEKSELITQLITKMSNIRNEINILSEKVSDSQTMICIAEGLKVEFGKTPKEFHWDKLLKSKNKNLKSLLIEQDSEKYIAYVNHSESYKSIRRLILEDISVLIELNSSQIAEK